MPRLTRVLIVFALHVAVAGVSFAHAVGGLSPWAVTPWAEVNDEVAAAGVEVKDVFISDDGGHYFYVKGGKTALVIDGVAGPTLADVAVLRMDSWVWSRPGEVNDAALVAAAADAAWVAYTAKDAGRQVLVVQQRDGSAVRYFAPPEREEPVGQWVADPRTVGPDGEIIYYKNLGTVTRRAGRIPTERPEWMLRVGENGPEVGPFFRVHILNRLQFSADGTNWCFWAAHDGLIPDDGPHLYVNGRRVMACESRGDFLFGDEPNHFVFFSSRGRNPQPVTQLLVHNAEALATPFLPRGGFKLLAFTPDGRRYAYMTGDRVVVDGELLEAPYDDGFIFSPSGTSYAYLSKEPGGGQTRVVVDGEVVHEGRNVTGLAYEPGSGRLAFVTDKAVVIDGEEKTAQGLVVAANGIRTLQWFPGGRHVIALPENGPIGVVDGRPIPALPAASALQFEGETKVWYVGRVARDARGRMPPGTQTDLSAGFYRLKLDAADLPAAQPQAAPGLAQPGAATPLAGDLLARVKGRYTLASPTNPAVTDVLILHDDGTATLEGIKASGFDRVPLSGMEQGGATALRAMVNGPQGMTILSVTLMPTGQAIVVASYPANGGQMTAQFSGKKE